MKRIKDFHNGRGPAVLGIAPTAKAVNKVALTPR
jgi:hypothetical protein